MLVRIQSGIEQVLRGADVPQGDDSLVQELQERGFCEQLLRQAYEGEEELSVAVFIFLCIILDHEIRARPNRARP